MVSGVQVLTHSQLFSLKWLYFSFRMQFVFALRTVDLNGQGARSKYVGCQWMSGGQRAPGFLGAISSPSTILAKDVCLSVPVWYPMRLRCMSHYSIGESVSSIGESVKKVSCIFSIQDWQWQLCLSGNRCSSNPFLEPSRTASLRELRHLWPLTKALTFSGMGLVKKVMHRTSGEATWIWKE